MYEYYWEDVFPEIVEARGVAYENELDDDPSYKLISDKDFVALGYGTKEQAQRRVGERLEEFSNGEPVEDLGTGDWDPNLRMEDVEVPYMYEGEMYGEEDVDLSKHKAIRTQEPSVHGLPIEPGVKIIKDIVRVVDSITQEDVDPSIQEGDFQIYRNKVIGGLGFLWR